MAITTQSCPDPITQEEVTLGDTTVTIYATEVARSEGINQLGAKSTVDLRG